MNQKITADDVSAFCDNLKRSALDAMSRGDNVDIAVRHLWQDGRLAFPADPACVGQRFTVTVHLAPTHDADQPQIVGSGGADPSR